MLWADCQAAEERSEPTVIASLFFLQDRECILAVLVLVKHLDLFTFSRDINTEHSIILFVQPLGIREVPGMDVKHTRLSGAGQSVFDG